MRRVDVLLSDGRVVPVVEARETPRGIELVCRLGRRYPIAKVVSYTEVEA